MPLLVELFKERFSIRFKINNKFHTVQEIAKNIKLILMTNINQLQHL